MHYMCWNRASLYWPETFHICQSTVGKSICPLHSIIIGAGFARTRVAVTLFREQLLLIALFAKQMHLFHPWLPLKVKPKMQNYICAASLCYVFALLAIQTWTEEVFIRIVVQQTRLLVNIVVKCLRWGLFHFENWERPDRLNGCLILNTRSMIQEIGATMSLSAGQKDELKAVLYHWMSFSNAASQSIRPRRLCYRTNLLCHGFSPSIHHAAISQIQPAIKSFLFRKG